MPQEHKKSIRNDILFILGILIAAIIGFVIFNFSLKSGNTVKVSVDGIEKFSYNLDENGEYTVKTGIEEENVNIIVIENGEVRVSEADCPDEICVKHRSISKVGETIVCLPHKLVVSVEAE